MFWQKPEGDSGKLRDRFQLDSCLIRVEPQLSLSLEHLRYPENLVAQLGLDVDFSEDGLVIAGRFAGVDLYWVLFSRRLADVM